MRSRREDTRKIEENKIQGCKQNNGNRKKSFGKKTKRKGKEHTNTIAINHKFTTNGQCGESAQVDSTVLRCKQCLKDDARVRGLPAEPFKHCAAAQRPGLGKLRFEAGAA